ncbi:hypothetical protein DPMN_134462 [Dreissena polymorpha]|uniref:Uncharacterized protein n=1 Tax=Dreissena polymorpha TaxID=45954 RepID=A0A9D4G228_DREPO|nr:hypothetical protein DPMN_134462 [Dreissena polymorpha]
MPMIAKLAVELHEAGVSCNEMYPIERRRVQRTTYSKRLQKMDFYAPGRVAE